MKLFKVPKKNRKWWILCSISTCLIILNLNTTIIAVILPKLYVDFGMTQVMQQWVVNIYLLFLGILMVIGGKISDLIGNRKAFFIGLFGFLFSSAFCGFAINGGCLLCGRALQGIFGAILMPNTAVVILKAFPINERATAIGIYAGITSLFLALGPLVGGFCTQFLSWRFVFLLNVPLGLFSILVASRTIPRFKKKVSKISIDWLGFLFLAVASSALLIALMEGVSFGWRSPFVITLFSISATAFTIFIIFEQRIKNPLIDFNIFHEKSYLFTCIIIVFVEIGMLSRVFWILFFQLGLSFSPVAAGLLIIPSAALGVIFAPFSGRLVDKYGSRLPITIGLTFFLIGFLWVSWFANYLNYKQVIFGIVLSGIGMAMTNNMSAIALANIPDESKGMAYATYQQIRQVCGTIGLAIIGAVFSNLNTHYFKTNLAPLNLPFAKQVSIDEFLASTLNGFKNLNIPQNLIPEMHKIAVTAYAKAFSLSMLLVAIFAVIGVCLSITKLSNRSQI